MIKRPLNACFRSAVCAGKKTTTIRDNPWPVGKPLMLYTWSGLPYRSKQNDVAPVVVSETRPVRITHRADGGMDYAYGRPCERPIHETEGFGSRAEMDAWFKPLVRLGETIEKHVMFFALANAKDQTRRANT